MTVLQKNILKAVSRRPCSQRELQDELKVDGNRLRYTVSAMVAEGMLTMERGKYAPGLATIENENMPPPSPARWSSWRPASALPAVTTARATFSSPAARCMAPCPRTDQRPPV